MAAWAALKLGPGMDVCSAKLFRKCRGLEPAGLLEALCLGLMTDWALGVMIDEEP